MLLDATRQFRDLRRAVAAGYQPTNDCVPGMGFHYGHPALAADPNIDPTLPDILMYAPNSDGTVRLVALEYFRADADGDTNTADDRPTLFGHPFDKPMAGHPVPRGQLPYPVHYDVHVWLYQTNPAWHGTNSLRPSVIRSRCSGFRCEFARPPMPHTSAMARAES